MYIKKPNGYSLKIKRNQKKNKVNKILLLTKLFIVIIFFSFNFIFFSMPKKSKRLRIFSVKPSKITKFNQFEFNKELS